MKLRHILTPVFGIVLVSCTTTTTVTEFPDGRKVTVTEHSVAPESLPLTAAAASVARAVLDEK